MEFKRTVYLQSPVNSMCVISDTLYIQSTGFIDDDEDSIQNYKNMIHAYSLQSFEHLFSFGKSYRSINPMVRDRMSTGSLSCNEASSVVVFAFDKMNVIQGYSAENGSLKWVNRIDDFNLPAITESIRDGRPVMSYGIPQSGIMDIILTPVEFDKEYMILQVLRSTTGSESNGMYHTFVLNSVTGTGSYLSAEFPEISEYYNGFIVSRDVNQDLIISQIYRVVSGQ